ncbi:Hypothetical protein PHPALM_1184, partial [Phytophthora palmivora]
MFPDNNAHRTQTVLAPPLLPITTTGSVGEKVEEKSQHHVLLGMACVAVSALCFSFMSTFIKYLTFTVTSMEAIFWRSMVACACNFIVVKVTGQSLYVPREHRKMLLVRCFVGFSSMGFAFYAISQMVLADASVIIFTSPVMTFFMGALFLHEKIDPISLISAIAAFGGLVCVVRPGFLFGYDHATSSTDGSWIAVCSGLLGALSQVFVFLIVRQLKGLNVFVIIHYFTISNVVFAFIWIALFQKTMSVSWTPQFWGAVFGCGLFTFLGQSFLTRGFQLEKAGIASVMRYLDVVFVFIWDAVILGEHINHWSVVVMSVGDNTKYSREGAPLLPTTSINSVVKVDDESNHHALLGIACVALASLCFSFMSTFIKYMTFTFSSMEATFWRSVGVLVCNYVVVKVSGISLYVEAEYRKMLLYRCIAGFACMGFAFYAMSQMVLADASCLVFTSPVLTFFMGALFLNEKIDPVSLISAVTAFGGLVCVVRPGFLFGYDHPTAATDGSWIAISSGLLGAVSQVFVFLTMRQLKGLNVFVIVHYFALAGVILTMLWLAFIQQ